VELQAYALVVEVKECVAGLASDGRADVAFRTGASGVDAQIDEDLFHAAAVNSDFGSEPIDFERRWVQTSR
jgi:hypothetical protein